MNKSKLVPALRFKGFDVEWERKKVSDIFEKITRGYVLSITKTRKFNMGSYVYPVYSSQTMLDGLMGYYDKYLFENSITWTTDGANAGTVKFRKDKFYCTNVCGVLLSRQGFANSMIAETLDKVAWKYVSKVGNPKLMNNIMAEIEINVTNSIDEQNKISTFISNLDKRITEQRQKIEKLKNIKKALLAKLFPAKGDKIPALRFKGFDEEWEERKLGEIGKCYAGIAFPECEQGGSCGIPFYKVSDMNIKGNEKYLVVANNYVSKEQVKNNNWKVLNNVPAIFFAKVGAAVFLNRKRIIKECCLMDNNTMAFVHDNEYDCNFIKEIFDKINMLDFVQVGALPSFNSSDVEGHSVMITMVKFEQKKIGSLMADLDNVVELQGKILIKLQNMKQACLQKMFV